MKAAVLHRFGQAPRYEDFPDPMPGPDDAIIRVQAVSLENFDRALARNEHYSNRQLMPKLPAIMGNDGIGQLDDGRLVGFGGLKPPYGSLAERVCVPSAYTIPIPEGISAVTAAAMPGSALSSMLPLRLGAKLQPHETVLINGATGFAGRLAVQIAKLLGAQRIVGTGRDPAALRSLAELGADGVIDLKQSDAKVIDAFKREGGAVGYQVILDFLWGKPTQLLLEALIPTELAFTTKSVRLVQIGEMAGPRVALPAAALRTSGVSISGAGAGLTAADIGAASQQVWDWIKEGQLTASIEEISLKDIKRAWKQTALHGKRIVIVP